MADTNADHCNHRCPMMTAFVGNLDDEVYCAVLQTPRLAPCSSLFAVAVGVVVYKASRMIQTACVCVCVECGARTTWTTADRRVGAER